MGDFLKMQVCMKGCEKILEVAFLLNQILIPQVLQLLLLDQDVNSC